MTAPPFSLTAAALVLLAGTVPRAGEADVLERIAVHPPGLRLNGSDDSQQLVVTGYRADGTTLDLTRSARFVVTPSSSVDVTPSGVVVPRAAGKARVEARVLDRTATVDVVIKGATFPRPVSFRRDVMAVLSRAGCNAGACHGNLNGKGGFRLSLRGEDGGFDHLTLTRESAARRVSVTSPETSLAVTKPTGLVPHEGGVRFHPSSEEARTLRDWIAAGAVDDQGRGPTVTGLEMFPESAVLGNGSDAQQLAVVATFSDGSRRDVTRQAAFDVNDPTRASVDPESRVKVSRSGEVVVSVRYLSGRAISRLAFLPDRPGFVWNGPPPVNAVDRAVFDKLRSLKIQPAPVATDPAFLRRAYLDAIGRLPTPQETVAFLNDRSETKRQQLVEALVRRSEFNDFWALKWADLLRNEEKAMGDKGVWVFQRWLRDTIAADAPLDEMARRLVTASGSTWQNPPASFFRTNRDPQAAAETVAQVFLGVRLQCARCHNHPFDSWTQDDYYGLAAVFANVRRKSLNNQRRDDLDKHEINGDELIYVDGTPQLAQPRSGLVLPAKAPSGPRLDGPEADARQALGRWLTRENPQFGRNVANRVWYHLTGRGVVEPVDDFRSSNPPSNPALLDALASELVANGYRLKPLVAFIMSSATYQLSSAVDETNRDDESNYSHAAVRLLPAEVLLDAVGQALEHSVSIPNAPRSLSATQFPGIKAGPFLKVFGKPERLLTCECERSESTTLAQAFQLINGPEIRSLLDTENNRIGRLLKSGADDGAVLDELSLAALSRYPTAAEREGFLAHVQKRPDRRRAWEDVAWALVNSKEFLLRH